MPERSIRLPLQIGTSGLLALERAALYLVPSLVLAIVAGIPLVVVMWNLGDLMGDTIGKYVFIVLLLPVLPFAYMVKRGLEGLSEAVTERPSDLVFDGDRVVVVGGPHHGLSVARDQLDCKLCGDGDSLEIRGIEVASAARPGERHSLAAVHQTLQALRNKAAPPPARKREIELVTCPTCSAPVVPADAATVPCSHCSASVPVPEEVRTRCRALATLADTAPRNQRRLRSLLRQPSARTANFLVVALGVPMLLVWPAIGFAGWALDQQDRLSGGALGLLALGGLTIVAALYFLVRVALVDRQGLALVTLHFGADPPAAPGQPATCRVCSAPLPAGNGSLFVRCAYCNSDNVLGIDVRGDATRQTAQAETLADALSRRSADRRRFGAAAVLAVAVLVGDSFVLRPIVHPVGTWLRCRHRGGTCGTPVEPLERRCASGDSAACTLALATVPLFDPDHLGGSDSTKALERGCTHGAAAGCRGAAARAWDGGLHTEDESARTLLARACDLGDAGACRQLGEILELRRANASFEAAEAVPDPIPAPHRSPDALARFHRACAAQDAAACLDEATYYLLGEGGIAADAARANALAATACRLAGPTAPACLQVACNRGEGKSCGDLAIAYVNGEGVTQDAELVRWADRHGCDHGYANACSDLGYWFEHDTAYPQDLAQAAALYQRGCDAGDGMGCHDMGVMLDTGAGRDEDDEGAARMFQHACDLGYGKSCDALAEMVTDGKGVEKDPARRAALYERGCKLGAQNGCLHVKCDHGDQDACEQLQPAR